jgi:hypothetical protein
LTFTPLPNSNGTAVVRIALADSGVGTPPHDNLSDDQTFTITVNAVNDAPQLVNPVASFAVDEDSPVTVIELFPTVFADVDVNPFDNDTLMLRVLSNSNPQLVATQLDNPLITSATTTSNLRLTYQPNRNGLSRRAISPAWLRGPRLR